MATKKREWYPGCTYHITNRGNHRNDTFRDDGDFGMYLLILKDCLKYYEFYKYELICYCLMTNHVHLLMKANERGVTDFMRRLNSMYATYFNKKYNYVGHLYQDKYFADVIEDDKQMLEASRYIHLNPVRAKMVEIPEDYKNSSYSMYIGLEEEKIITSSRVLNYFVEDRKRELYKEFVESKINIKVEESGDENLSDCC
jgi:putative transposase